MSTPSARTRSAISSWSGVHRRDRVLVNVVRRIWRRERRPGVSRIAASWADELVGWLATTP